MPPEAEKTGSPDLRTPAKFLVSGLANTAITYALFLALLEPFGPSIAYTATYAVGIVLAYLLSTRFVFNTGHTARMAVAVPLSYVAQYLYGLAALNILIRLGLPGAVAMAGVVVSAVPMQYLILRFAAAAGRKRTRDR